MREFKLDTNHVSVQWLPNRTAGRPGHSSSPPFRSEARRETFWSRGKCQRARRPTIKQTIEEAAAAMGIRALNDWLATKVSQFEKKDLARTYVLVEKNKTR